MKSLSNKSGSLHIPSLLLLPHPGNCYYLGSKTMRGKMQIPSLLWHTFPAGGRSCAWTARVFVSCLVWYRWYSTLSSVIVKCYRGLWKISISVVLQFFLTFTLEAKYSQWCPVCQSLNKYLSGYSVQNTLTVVMVTYESCASQSVLIVT